MNKIVSTLIVAAIAQMGFSQEITTDFFYKSGIQYNAITDYDPDFIEQGPSGADVLWDFESIVVPPDFPDTVNIVDASESEYFDIFPNSNICKIEKNQFFDTHYFYVQNDTRVSAPGFVMPFGNDTTIIQLNHTVGLEGLSLMDTLWRNTDSYFQFDGIGTVITPEGEFDNCIRMKLEVFSTQFITYLYYQDNLSHKVLEVSPSKFDSLQQSNFGILSYTYNYQDEALSRVPEKEKLRNLNVSWFNNQFQIEYSGEERDVQLSLYTIDGQLLMSGNYSLSPGSHSYSSPHDINTNGYLVFFIVDRKTGEFKSQKILSAH